MKTRDYVYILCMFFFIVLAYLFFDRGINVRTQEVVRYQESSNLGYKVYLHPNKEYDQEYLNMGNRYVKELVDKIVVDFNYKSIFDKNVNGFYKYSVVGILHAYLDNINDSIWDKEYTINDEKVVVLNQNNEKNIDISSIATIDYDKYEDALSDFSKKYGLSLSGYLEVNVIINENLKFNGIEKVINDEKKMSLIIPLSYDTFRITVNNDNNKVDKYHNFNKRNNVNYVLVIIGSIMLAFAISFMALVIREIVNNTSSKTKYMRELNSILKEYDEIIVKVKRFYNKKKYNFIYVDSFKELLDAYYKIENPICFREIKKNEEAMFMMIDEDSAWIYQMRRGKK